MASDQQLEAFALARDRLAVLKSLVPGTADHFLFASLLAEQEGHPPHLKKLIDEWERTHPDHEYTALFANRRRLAGFTDGSSAGDKQLLAQLAQLLGAQLQHEPPAGAEDDAAAAEIDGGDDDDDDDDDDDENRGGAALPSALDEAAVATSALLARVLQRAADVGALYLTCLNSDRYPLEQPAVLAALRDAHVTPGAEGLHLVEALQASPTLPAEYVVVPLLAHALGCEYTRSRGLGERLLARLLPRLTSDQLQQLAGAVPSVRSSTSWGAAVLRRLAPPSHVDLRTSPPQLDAYLAAVAAALEGLPPCYNTARHTVLYHQLLSVRAAHPRHSLATPTGLALLRAYVALPRAARHWNVDEGRERDGAYVDAPQRGGGVHAAGHGALREALVLPPPSRAADDALITDGLLDVFAADTAPPGVATAPDALQPWAAHLSLRHLRHLVATARLTRGSDADRAAAHSWVAHLAGGAEGLAALQGQTELTIHAASCEYLPADGPVALRFAVKNPGPGVASVGVRVFEVNTTAWYAAKGVEVPSDVDLDGLLPHEELQLPLPPHASPLQQLELELPLLSLSGRRRGVFVVELVAGGTSARVLFRKGQLRLLERLSVGGHVLTVLDEANAPLPAGCALEASLGGRRFAPDAPDAAPGGDASAACTITIPFAASAATQPLVLTVREPGGGAGWSFSSLVPDWRHEAEAYSLDAAIHVDREALVSDNYAASVLLRPRLTLACGGAGTPVPLRALTNVTLVIGSTDASGAVSSRVVRDFRLHADKESVLPFAVPPRLRSLTFQLSCDVELIATGAKQRLSVTKAVAVNGIDATDGTRALHLTRAATGGAGYCLHLLGKGGEPVAGARVTIELQHALVSELGDDGRVQLRTDAAGCVQLGPLHGFTHVSATCSGVAAAAELELPADVATYAATVHTSASEAVQARLPFRPDLVGTAQPGEAVGTYTLARADLSLVELRHGAVARDCFHAASYNASSGFVEVQGLPAGDYELRLKRPTPNATRPGPTVTIRVLPGSAPTAATGAARLTAGHLAHGNTLLQLRPHACPLSVVGASVRRADGCLVVRVAGGTSAGAAAGAAPSVGADVRVHVLATRFVPHWDAPAALAALAAPGLSAATFEPPRSRFMSNRTLGEEQRYILDRAGLLASGRVHPGNSLPRPSLLLNLWSLGTVASDVQTAMEGGAYESLREGAARKLKSSGFSAQSGSRQRQSRRGGSAPHAEHVSLDFLTAPSVLLANLRPDGATCELAIPLSELAAACAGDVYVTIVAVDALHTASLALPVALTPPTGREDSRLQGLVRDLTTSRARLDPALHLLQQSRVTALLRPGDTCVVSATGTKVEVYASLDRAFALLATRCSRAGTAPTLASEFGWLLQLPQFSDAEKCARYSKHACHEVHLFLFLRDAPFFERVVAPYIASKRAKGFMDHWLLGHDLAAYTASHTFPQLNAAERALLAAAVGSPAVAAAIASHARDFVAVHPLEREAREALFEEALASSALDEPAEGERELHVRRECRRGPAVAAQSESLHVVNECYRESQQCAPRPMAASAPPPMAMMARRQTAQPMMMAAMADCAPASMMEDESRATDDADLARRARARDAPTYRPLDKTEELAEAQYYRVRAADDTPELVEYNEFWRDVAAHMAALQPAVAAAAGPAARRAVLQAARPCVSVHFAQCAGSVTEALLALATLGLPWEADDAAPPQPPRATLTAPAPVSGGDAAAAAPSASPGGSVAFTAAGTPAILFHRDIVAVAGVGASADAAQRGSGCGSGGSGGSSGVDAAVAPTVLVGQSYFDPADAHTGARGEETFLPPGAELAPGRVYGCFVVLSNITQAQLQLDALLCLPAGALPVSDGSAVRTHSCELDGYSSTTVRYFFYFPAAGRFEHYPVHVSSEGVLVAHAAPVTLVVALRPARKDVASWAYLAARGTPDEVFAFLATANTTSTDLELVLWRCCAGRGGAGFWRRLVGLMRERLWFDPRVWELALLHGDADTLRELLRRRHAVAELRGHFVSGVAPAVTCALLSLVGEHGVGADSEAPADAEPVLPHAGDAEGGAYEHLEYSPLVNARAHQLGAQRRILNAAVARQFRALLRVLSCKPAGAVSPSDLLAITYHLLLQDRVGDALECFARVPPPAGSVAAAAAAAGGAALSATGAAAVSPPPPSPGSSWSLLQYDYLAAYLDFFRHDDAVDAQEAAADDATAAVDARAPRLGVACAVARAYARYPVPKWAARFEELRTQLLEAGVLAADDPAGAVAGSGGDGAEAGLRGVAPAPLGSGLSPGEVGVGAELAREAALSRAAARDPLLELAVSRATAGGGGGSGGATLELTYAHLSALTLRFFAVDLELLFSSSPFALLDDGGGASSGGGGGGVVPAAGSSSSGSRSLGQFSFVRPTHTLQLALPAGSGIRTHTLPLPAPLGARNLMVEATGDGSGLRRVVPHFACGMHATFNEPLGRLRVAVAAAGGGGAEAATATGAAAGARPLPRAYVKVYWRESDAPDARGQFLKDGYTDLRGVFDYASVSTDELARARGLAVLVCHPVHGSLVRLVAPPRT